MKQLLRNAVNLLVRANRPLSIETLYDAITTGPPTLEAVESEGWREQSFCYACLVAAKQRDKTPRQEADFAVVAKYWLREFAGLNPRTKSIIVSMFTSVADLFLRGLMADIFGAAKTNLYPELTHEGRIIVIDLPVKEYGAIGQMAQVLYKWYWQQATERRDVDANPRPCFLWADECQFFITERDMDFQTTARSARAATVYITQNQPNLYAALPGSRGRDVADSVLGNLSTKIFHANSEPKTNEWAAEIISKDTVTRPGWSLNSQEPFVGQMSVSGSEQVDWQVPPIAFTTLRKGGRANSYQVEAIVFQGGRRWKATGANYIPALFSQIE